MTDKKTLTLPLGVLSTEAKYITNIEGPDWHICQRKLLGHGGIDMLEVGNIFFNSIEGVFTCLSCRKKLNFRECFDTYINKNHPELVFEEPSKPKNNEPVTS